MRVRRVATNGQVLRLTLIASLALLTSCKSATNQVLEETFEQFYAIPPSAKITINNGDGAVLVYGSNANEMRVHAVKKAYSRARLAQIAVSIDLKPGSVSIATRFPPKPKWGLFDRSGTVDYTIVVPATTDVSSLDLDAGEILLDGMRGRTTRARLGEGRMSVRNCFTNLDLAIRCGNLIMSYDWWEQSKFSAEASITQGNAWAYLPSDAAFHLLAKAEGKISSDFESTAPASNAGIMDALVNGGGDATIKVRVAKGNIKIVESNP